MKKFLLTAFAVLTAAFSYADDVKVSWSAQADWTGIGEQTISYTNNGIKLTAVKNDGATNPTVNGNSNDLRVYAKGTLTVAASAESNITSIQFTISAAGKKRLTTITPSTGSVSYAEDYSTVTWTGSANSVDFTVGEKAVYGTDGETKAGQFDIDAPITVSGTIAGGSVVDPSVDPDPEDPQPEVDLVSVADAQSAAAGTEVAVQGTVVAACQNGAVIGDGTGYIFYYNTANDLTVGERVTIAGAVSAYGGFNQLTAAATVSKQGTANVTYPNVQVMTGADLDAWIAAPAISYVEYTGTLNISGNYYNVNIEGAETAVGSLIKPTAAMLEGITNGSEVVITGFAMYVSGTKYVNTVATSIKLKGEAAETVDITNTLETAYSVSKAIELIEAGKGLENKVYVKGIVCAPYKDMFIDTNYGNATFFISEDGSAESQQFEIYRGYDFGGQKFTDDTKIKLGDEVVFYGTLTKYNTTYETNQGAELVLLNGMDAAASVQNITTEHAGAIYDLQGRRVQNATKGIYVINGRKVLK